MVTVIVTLPTGLTATAISGTGCSCTLGSLSCTRSDVLAASGSYPAITVTVTVASSSEERRVGKEWVSGGWGRHTAKDSTSDVTTVTGSGVRAMTRLKCDE